MNYICVGKIVNTHALKGEVKIISDFSYKDRVFVKNKKLYIGEDKEEVIVESYRIHKIFDMIKFKEKSSINEVIGFKTKYIYINKEDLILNDEELLNEELIGMKVYKEDVLYGTIEGYIFEGKTKLIVVSGKYLPYKKELISKIDKKNRCIYYNDLLIL